MTRWWSSMVGIALVVGGCMSSLMSPTPVTRVVPVQGSPEVAYHRASVALAHMGGTVQQFPATRQLSSVVHGAVQLTVTVLGTGEQSEIHVTGSLIPGKVVIGSFTEVEDYVALLQ